MQDKYNIEIFLSPAVLVLCYVSYSLQGDQTRQVRHFHFTAWPDFGVPKKPQSLVRFVRTVRAKLFKDGGPILTHCRYEYFYSLFEKCCI